MKKILFLLALPIAFLFSACNKDNNTSGTSNNMGNGTGGSLARFTLYDDYLYVVDHRSLHTYNVSDPSKAVSVNITPIDVDIETIFAFQNKLFIGSKQAMYIYNITNPINPTLLGTASHIRACDPVVANSTVAFVTVRSGSSCGGDVNALIAYNIIDPTRPTELNRLNLSNPYGLGIKDNLIYVCDAQAGLRIIKKSGLSQLSIEKTITGEIFYDCIIFENLLYCMVQGGVSVYDISSPLEPVRIAQIK
jgi:hypothetical protein